MKFLLVASAALGMCCGTLAAQDEHSMKRPAKPPLADTAPVTQAEAGATFNRVDDLLKRVLHVSAAAFKTSGNPNAPIRRAQVLAEFDRLYASAEPSFRVTPKGLAVDTGRLTVDVPRERDDLVRMIHLGFVGNYGPLATGKVTTLTVHDFGESVGFFLTRIGECTHKPSSKWTPYLHGD